MNHKTTCNHCGAVQASYTLPFNRHMLNAFIQFSSQFLKDGKALKKGQMNLTNPQYSNWQNLRHFNIIFQLDSKQWILTKTGEQFFRGDISIITPVAHRSGMTLEDSDPAWETHNGPRLRKYIWELLGTAEMEWKQREEFQREKNSTKQRTLF